MEEHRRLKDGLNYAQNAHETYVSLNGETSDLSICSLWLVISISYSIKSSKVNDYCE